MLSIGLGQEQQFTLILQTLQQLKDVYGDSVDKIVQGNTSNIIFLKSTDDAMLDTLQKMSGTTHKVYKDSKTVTRDNAKPFMANEAKVSYTMSVKEVPVISYNDMAFIPMCNSIIFRAGNSPIWNRNETALPMSWRLFANTIIQPGKEYSLQTIPTLSSALDFDVRKNQPNFIAMWEKRRDQFVQVDDAVEAYMSAYHYKEADVMQLDPDNYSDDIMQIVNQVIKLETPLEEDDDFDDGMGGGWDPDDELGGVGDDLTDLVQGRYEDNDEANAHQARATQASAERDAAWRKPKFAGGMLAPEDLCSLSGVPNRSLDEVVMAAYDDTYSSFREDPGPFEYRDDRSLWHDGTCLICRQDNSAFVARLEELAREKGTRVWAEGKDAVKETQNSRSNWYVAPEFYKIMANMASWRKFAKGKFDEAMKRRLDEKEGRED